MTIRKATADDFDAIWPMLRTIFRAGDTYAIDPDITAEDARRYWMEDVTACYVACDAGVTLGTYYIKQNQPGGGAHVCNCGYIVDPHTQGRGIARLMCETSQDQARSLGFRAMQFNFVLDSNAHARRLWHRLGFVTIGTIPAAFDHPHLGLVDAHVMHKSL